MKKGNRQYRVIDRVDTEKQQQVWDGQWQWRFQSRWSICNFRLMKCATHTILPRLSTPNCVVYERKKSRRKKTKWEDPNRPEMWLRTHDARNVIFCLFVCRNKRPLQHNLPSHMSIAISVRSTCLTGDFLYQQKEEYPLQRNHHLSTVCSFVFWCDESAIHCLVDRVGL